MDRIRKLLLGVAILPVGIATAYWSIPATPAAMSPGEPHPALVFRQYAVHLGPVSPSPRIGADFDFRNRSDSPVKILSVTPSCGCLQTKLVDPKEEYRPGAFGRLQLSMSTPNEEPGFHDYTIRVAYDDGQPREQVLRFSLTLPEKTVQIEPSEIYFYQLNGEPDSRTIEVADYREKPLEVTDVTMVIGAKPCPPEIAAAVAETPIVRDGESRTPIRINVAGVLPSPRTIAHVVISTNDPEYRTMKCPVLIQGPTSAVTPASAEVPAR